MKICCGIKDCSVAYMVENNCFAITCKEQEQCKTFIKSPLENSPVIGFVDRSKPSGYVAIIMGDHPLSGYKRLQKLPTYQLHLPLTVSTVLE